MQIIAKKGAAGATLAEIGVAAGFSRGLPAERFGTKLALLSALIDFMEGWFQERVRQAVAGKAGMAALSARIDAHIDGASASPVATAAIYTLFVESLCVIPELQSRTRALSASFHDGFRDHLDQAKRRGELRNSVNSGKAAGIIVGALRGLIIQSLLDGDTAALAAARGQVHALIETGLRKAGFAIDVKPVKSRRRSL
jgi:AcrR family transcriptional regulator